MSPIIIPDTLLEQLSSASNAGFVFLSAEQMTGKTSMMKTWLAQQQAQGRGWIYVDCQYQKLDDNLRLEAETILSGGESLAQKEQHTNDSDGTTGYEQATAAQPGTAKECEPAQDSATALPPFIYTNTAGITYEQTPKDANTRGSSQHAASESNSKHKYDRQIVVFDHLPPEDVAETTQWLATLIKRYQTQLLFIIVDHQRVPNVLLRLAFECQGVLLSSRHCQLRIGDLLKARAERQWPISVSELIETLEHTHGHNLVSLDLLNQALPSHLQFTLPQRHDWARKIFHGLSAPEIAGARLLSALGWTLPAVLKLLLPTLPFQEFLDRLRQRQWLEEHHYNSNLLVRINHPLSRALSHFSPANEHTTTLRQEKLWTIQLMNRQHVPPAYTLRTWLTVGNAEILSIFLNDLQQNNKLVTFAEHTAMTDLNGIPDELMTRYPELTAITYTRAINSSDSAAIQANQSRWQAFIGDQARSALSTPDPQIQIIQSAHTNLFSRPDPTPPGTNHEKTRLLPAWLEANSRLMLMHTLTGIAHQRPDQHTFSQLEKVALKAAQSHDEDTVINTLKTLAILTLRFGHIDYYIKSTRYTADWAKHLDKEKAGTAHSLALVQRPIDELIGARTLLQSAPWHTTHSTDAALGYLLNLGESFSEAWCERRTNCLGFLARAQAHYDTLAPHLKQYAPNPKLLKQLFGLAHTDPQSEHAQTTELEALLVPVTLSANDSPYDEPLVHLVNAMIQLHEQAYVSAQSSFEQAQLSATDLGCTADLMWCHALAARLYVIRNDDQNALAHLKPLLEILDHPGIILPFSLIDKSLKPLLELANQHRVATPEQITRCRKAFPYLFLENELTPAVSALLSKREYEILQYMSEGRSNDEISKLLHRSVGTVKLHAHNIYKKLKVKNRVEAINLYKQSELMAGDYIAS
jgi:DNA-binding CsgD family transcriptional regulator